MTTDLESKTFHQSISLWILGFLIILRIPFLVGIPLVTGKSPTWIEPVFDVGTYFLTAALIWLARDQLGNFFISPLALWIILIFKPLMPLLIFAMGGSEFPLSFPNPVSFLYLLISLGLLYALKRSGWKWKQVTPVEWKWLGWGVLVGLGLAVLGSYPMALNLIANRILYSPSLEGLSLALIRVPQQLGYAAITEEPLFRGFLWGFLRKLGWNPWVILFFQTLLFMLGHVYYLKNMPLMFFVVIPISGLGLGLLAWRSRTIVSSMLAHSMINAFGIITAQIAGMIIPL